MDEFSSKMKLNREKENMGKMNTEKGGSSSYLVVKSVHEDKKRKKEKGKKVKPSAQHGNLATTKTCGIL